MSQLFHRQAQRIWITLFLFTGWVFGAGASVEREWDWGFLASRSRDPEGVMRTRVLGPFFESARSSTGSELFAVRPFYASEKNLETGWKHRDYLWPVGRYGRLENDTSWRFLTTYSHHYDVSNPQGRYRLWVLPFYFQGRDAEGRSYGAVFPIGGRIHEILNFSECAFILFPIWARNSIGEVKTQHVLWPVYSKTHGNGIDRFRVFPFYGRNQKHDLFKKRFICWPFFTDVKYTYPNSKGYGFILFPFWGRMSLSDQETWMLFPPLIRKTRAQQMNLLTVWPFYQRRTGKEDRMMIWPFYGRSRVDGVSRSYYLWPIVRKECLDRGDAILKRTFVFPFFQSKSLRLRAGSSGVEERRVQVWPLMSYDRRGATRRVRLLELWPLLNTVQIERSWAPLWTLFEYRSRGEDHRTEVLWGVFRRQTRGETWRRTSLFPLVEWEAETSPECRSRSWSILKGLVARESSKQGVKYRILYLLHWGGAQSKAVEP